ncbi:Similar to Eml1: Echinoderm microtubule-associated protein-like 1 (Rattus norvegicus) [Cotesia congregata]|uniref:Similar to Eml1: Echinoderm microtubule-associated protein-like 1 (Rattus norvegicus) n=1 Tax=Cotesia congregata TaxID=51543 RepID=A0A8J2HI00_COTCN|nr:Similar to Eml1: Echinoderm microtubule-associated protein-like 1 (Rattus norvegicus) [Cotesia congregata]
MNKNQSRMMHVNGHNQNSSQEMEMMNTIDEAEQAWNEMLECETGSLLGRVADLERQSLAQRDEIVCLPTQNSAQKDVVRNRQTNSPCLKNSSSSGSSQDVRDSNVNSRRPVSYTAPSQLPQRRSVHYQSTNSLHSDSPSSSSVSPVPSPSPRATPLPTASRSPTTRLSNGPPQSSLRRAKRWSSTGDFIHSPQSPNSQLTSSRLSTSTKSLFNLFKPPVLNNVKHGKLKLDWVYGYRGKDCRSNLHLLPTGEIVYFVASVVVLYNMEEHCQRHYLGHTDDVKCIAIHPNKLVIATGQVAGHDKRDAMCSVDTVVCADWHPLERNQIVSCGKGHVSFWSLDNGGMLYKRMGVFEAREKPRYVTCLAFNQNGDVLTGDSNGNVIVWARGTNTIANLVKNLHEGSIFSICVLKSGNIVTGGGKDGRILYLDNSLQQTGEGAQIEDHFGGIRTLSEGRGSQLLIGTTRNCILVGDTEIGFCPAMLGHTEEVWGLAAHPTLPQFATAGHDRLLQMWDSLSHSVVWSKDIGEQAHSVCFSPDGSVMVVGCVSGKWLVIDSESREFYTHHNDGTEALQVAKYSPDGMLLAIGSRDNCIYIYQINETAKKYSRVGRCMGHSSFITHLDWSVDSQYLRSNSGDYELLYWNPRVCRQIPQSSNLRDVEWASHTCVISFETIGVWPEGADGTDVNNCTRSGEGKLLATGDDFGKVRLFSYPACQPKSLSYTYGGHSSHVTNVTFLHDDTRLVSIGGNDTSVLQWIVSSKTPNHPNLNPVQFALSKK